MLEPREVTGLPNIRSLRCGGHHMMASSADGDVFVWGCGLTHQLGNRPRDVQNPLDIEEDPEDELRPYRISSKQLEKRFVMLADGGAQHTVELAWDTSYRKLQADDAGPSSSQTDLTRAAVPPNNDFEIAEPPAKRRLTEATEATVAEGDEVMAQTDFAAGFGHLTADDGKWKCEICSLRWEMNVIQCKACESYQPGLSEEAIGKMEAEKEAHQSETVAKFQTASSVKPTGFSFPSTVDTGSITFGTSAAPPGFGFSTSQSSAFGASNAGFSAGASFGFGQSGSVDVGSLSFGFGGSTSSSAPAKAATFGFNTSGNDPQGKKLDELPDFSRNSEIPVGDVFVHGSGECDQLGLGDETRERRKPTLLKALVGKQICEISVGAMHVLCVSAGGGLYSWGCNDDGALGRISSDGSDGAPSDVEPNKVDMPSGVVVRKVSCGDCHSCALDDRGRVWLWGTYKDSNGYIGIVHKRKQEAEVLEKSAEPTLVLEGCSVIASGANHTVALVEALGGKKAVAWGSNATGQLGLPDSVGCGFAEKVLSGNVEGLAACNAGGCEVSGEAVVRLKDANGTERNAEKMTLSDLQQALAQGSSLIVQAPDREVPKAEKKKLLHPQDVCLSTAGIEGSSVQGIFASAECSFITVNDGTVLGCGLNGDGQVGLGFASMAVQTLRLVRRLQNASWLGGGLHSTAALAGSRVFTWGKAEECGLGLGEKDLRLRKK